MPPHETLQRPQSSGPWAMIVAVLALLIGLIVLLLVIFDGACRPDPVPAGAPATTEARPLEGKVTP